MIIIQMASMLPIYMLYTWLYLHVPFAAVVISSVTILIELAESIMLGIEISVTAMEVVLVVTSPEYMQLI